MKKTNLFSFRSEWRDYCVDCWSCGEMPWGFKDWFETVHHYEMADDMPSGEHFNGSFANYSAVCLN